MALKIYIVCPNDPNYFKLVNDRFIGKKYNFPEPGLPDVGVFYDEAQAHLFAKNMAAINGGRELSILESTHQYYAKPSTVGAKVWKGGELLPITA